MGGYSLDFSYAFRSYLIKKWSERVHAKPIARFWMHGQGGKFSGCVGRTEVAKQCRILKPRFT